MEGLVAVVSSALEARGVLPKIRAELRANVYSAIHEHDTLDATPHSHKLQKIKAEPAGEAALLLVHEMLHAATLDYTASVYVPEANLEAAPPDRAALAQILGLSPAGDEPLLVRLLRESCASLGALPPRSTHAQTPADASPEPSSAASPARSRLGAKPTAGRGGGGDEAAPPRVVRGSSDEERRLDALESKLAGLAGLSTSADEVDDSSLRSSRSGTGTFSLDELVSPDRVGAAMGRFDHVEEARDLTKH